MENLCGLPLLGSLKGQSRKHMLISLNRKLPILSMSETTMPKNWQQLSSKERLESSQRLINAHDAFLKEGRNVNFYDYQVDFRKLVFDGLFLREYVDVGYEVSRQAGKTTGIAEPIAFLAGFADMLFQTGSRPFGIGFFAPREDQYMTDWLRVRDIMPDICAMFGLIEMVNNDTLMRYGRPTYDRFGRNQKTVPRVEFHGYSLGEGTKVESKTLDLAIIEEAQDIDDVKVDKMVRPMLTSTDGLMVHIGVAGYRKCYFKKLIDSKKNCVIWPFDKVIECRQQMFEKTGDEYHLNYKKFIDKELNRIGQQITDEFRTQYMLEWVTDVGNFITEEALKLLKRDKVELKSKWVRVGIDFGKSHDFTVATIVTELGQRLGSLRLNGTDYMDQIPIVLDWIQDYCDDHPFESINEHGQPKKEPLKVEYVQYDHTGVGNAVGEFLDDKCKWVVRPLDFTAKVKADMFQDLLNLIAVGTGIAKGLVEDTGQRRFEYDANDPNVQIFEYEATEAEKEYKGQLGILDVRAPEKKDKHDDTLYSLILGTYEGESEPSLGVAYV